jgi:spore coat protein CotH
LWGACLVLSGCGAADSVTGPSSGAASDPVFDQSILHDVRIAMDPADWQALRDNFRENQYYAADVTIDNQVVRQIGLRSRGSGSRSAVKPGLKFDFNKNVKDQEFHGYKSLVIDNITQDVTMLRERLAYSVYEGMGLAAPQISHTRLTVNGEYWGVYAIIEPVSKPFLKRRLGNDTGTLYDYQYAFQWNFSFRGDRPEAYVPEPFQPETNEDHLDPGPLVDFVRTANYASDATFPTDIARFIDVDRFVTYLAVENALAEHDGFVGDLGVNNFYLYEYGNSTKFALIPWDKDTALTAPEWPLLYNLETNVLVRRILADPAKLKLYRDTVARAGSTFVNARFLVPRLDQAYNQIRSAVLADTKKPFANATFEEGIVGMRALITAREGNIAAQVK